MLLIILRFFENNTLIKIVVGLMAVGLLITVSSDKSKAQSLRLRSIQTDTTFLNNEAGIAAYVHVQQSLDPATAEGAFRTIEAETDSFIIGSVPLDEYPEEEDPHVYLHQSGWVIAYYLNDEPVTKMIDWINYDGGSITNTKLEQSLSNVLIHYGLSINNLHYYDFKYPQATNIMLIGEYYIGTDTDPFEVYIPSEMSVFERSWVHVTLENWYGTSLDLDGVEIHDEFGILYGFLTLSQLAPDEFHLFELDNSGKVVIAIVYQMPQ